MSFLVEEGKSEGFDRFASSWKIKYLVKGFMANSFILIQMVH